MIAWVDEVDGAIAFGERKRLQGGGDGDGVCGDGLCLGGCRLDLLLGGLGERGSQDKERGQGEEGQEGLLMRESHAITILPAKGWI